MAIPLAKLGESIYDKTTVKIPPYNCGYDD
jgi:hypothetical protein